MIRYFPSLILETFIQANFTETDLRLIKNGDHVLVFLECIWDKNVSRRSNIYKLGSWTPRNPSKFTKKK